MRFSARTPSSYEHRHRGQAAQDRAPSRELAQVEPVGLAGLDVRHQGDEVGCRVGEGSISRLIPETSMALMPLLSHATASPEGTSQASGKTDGTP